MAKGFGKSKSKKSKVGLIIGIVILLLVVAGGYVGYRLLEERITAEFSEKIKELKDTINENKRVVYSANADIKAGTIITENDVSVVMGFSDMDGSLFAAAEDVGKRAKVDIPAGEYIYKSMLSDKEFTSQTRSNEYQFIYMGSQISAGDYVDVRILYPDGTDYVVLSKHCVESVADDGSSVIMWVDEEDILLMDAAVVDAFVYSLMAYNTNKVDSYTPSKNSRIYAVKYVEPTLQEASKVTYTPSVVVTNEINSNPNIVNVANSFLSEELRAQIEERLFKYMSTETMNALGYEDYEDFFDVWKNYTGADTPYNDKLNDFTNGVSEGDYDSVIND